MIVAARASDRETQECARGCLNLFIDEIQHELPAVLRVVSLATDGEKSGRDQLIGALAIVPGGEEISSYLHADEAIIRHVGVERRDHPVAIAPGLRIGKVRLAARLGESRDIEPVPPSTLAKAGRGKQAIDHAGESLGRIVLEKGINLLGRRRKPNKIERHPA